MTYRKLFCLVLALALILVSSVALAAYSVLEFGDRGSDVLKLQQALSALGFDPNGTDGKFGRGTENAVKLYQASRGLEADGKAGNQTLTKLYSENTGSGSASSGSTGSSSRLEYGNESDAVMALQQKLKALGYDPNGVDGRFGAGTQKAVIRFQKSVGLKADGIAGSQTLAALETKYAALSSGSGSGSGSIAGGEAVALGSRTLRKGYTGSDVTQLQIYLSNLGYYSGSLDGVYGTGTIAAVKAFQKKNNLEDDGLAGGNTVSVLTSSSAISANGTSSSTSGSTSSGTTTTPSTGTSYSTLRSGATGTEVTNLQNRLVTLGYTLNVNGSYDKATKNAVIAFQTRNGLDSDGVAGALTQTQLYSSSAVRAAEEGESSVTIDENTGKANGPSTSQVQLLHWFDEIKPTVKSGQYITIFDPATSLSWRIRFYSLGRHADSEPVTATDTAIMFKAFGNQNTWTPKPVYVQLPDGRWTLATMHNTPHLSGSIKDNDFDGHLCIHFLRDMSECEKNDPDYGVQHQNAIRKKWKEMTGIEVPYK